MAEIDKAIEEEVITPDSEEVDIEVEGVSFQIIDDSKPWQLEVVSREAGLIETIDTERTITTDSVTNTLSVFSQ